MFDKLKTSLMVKMGSSRGSTTVYPLEVTRGLEQYEQAIAGSQQVVKGARAYGSRAGKGRGSRKVEQVGETLGKLGGEVLDKEFSEAVLAAATAVKELGMGDRKMEEEVDKTLISALLNWLNTTADSFTDARKALNKKRLDMDRAIAKARAKPVEENKVKETRLIAEHEAALNLVKGFIDRLPSDHLLHQSALIDFLTAQRNVSLTVIAATEKALPKLRRPPSSPASAA